MEVTEEALAAMFAVVSPHLDERQRRLLAGAQARALGRGGIGAVARASGMARSTVEGGTAEIDQGAVPAGRVRRSGAGRPRRPTATQACWPPWTRWSSRPPGATPARRCAGPASRPATWPTS